MTCIVANSTNTPTVPDFRSSEGLFKTLKAEHNLKGSGKDLFDAAVYRDASSTSSFHSMVRSMSSLTRSLQPTPFHHLVARLAHEGRLLRLYSQNVDGLETSLEPLRTQVPLPLKSPWPKTVQLHGGLEKMACSKCNTLSDFQPDLFDGPVPPLCAACEDLDRVRTEHAGKRSHGVGRLRPRMVLYNEHNPDDEAIGAVARADMRTRPDAVVVVGTTLKVPGVRRIVREMCQIVRARRDGLAVWINHDPVPSGKDVESCWDLVVRGTADDVADRAGLGRWDDEPLHVEALSGEDAKMVEGREPPQVVIMSPAKPSRPVTLEDVKCENEMPDPLDEKDCIALAPSLNASASPKPLGRPKLLNPASQGRSINTVLGRRKSPLAKRGTRPTGRPPTAKKTPTGNAPASSKLRPKKRSQPKEIATTAPTTTQNLKQHFKTTKPANTAAVSTKKAKAPTTSPQQTPHAATDDNQTAPRPTERKSRSSSPPSIVPGKAVKAAPPRNRPMDPVSPSSRKVNGASSGRDDGEGSGSGKGKGAAKGKAVSGAKAKATAGSKKAEKASLPLPLPQQRLISFPNLKRKVESEA